ncbi:hypothetical protein [Pseudomonas sp. 4810-S13]|uniref:hypothetical protein n=1 Tax=Pseudomonas sp. 4810-S13 TaxID=3120822 RepID=UPI0031B69737
MRADWIKLMIAAARLPLRSDPKNHAHELPRPNAESRVAQMMISIHSIFLRRLFASSFCLISSSVSHTALVGLIPAMLRAR